MNFTAAIDISTFIWCEKDYNDNKNKYQVLTTLTPTVYDKIKQYKVPVLLRNELYELIISEFPYNVIEELGYDFQKLTLSFLTDTFSNWIQYTDNDDDTITSNPLLKKQYFSNNIKAETQSQMCHLFYNGKNPEHKFIAYNYFYPNYNLTLNRQESSTEIETLLYNTEAEIIQFFEKHKIKFEHNQKHTNKIRYANGEKISPFTCYHKDGETKAQKLLEESHLYKDDYYNFDIDNNVYIKFVKTIGLTYHGYDLSDEKNNVPNQVKNKYNKDGRVF